VSSRLLSKDVKIQKTIILPVVLYGCKTWPLAQNGQDRVNEMGGIMHSTHEEEEEEEEVWRQSFYRKT
jgi:hypothetical protein